jgi:hypothetical protein
MLPNKVSDRQSFYVVLQSLSYCIAPRAPSRRKPAIIDLDNNEEDNEESEYDNMDVDESSQSRKYCQPTISNANNGSESTSEHDGNTDSTDIDPSDVGNDDLTDLNSASLQKKITSEVKLLQSPSPFVCIYLLSSILGSAATVEKPSS